MHRLAGHNRLYYSGEQRHRGLNHQGLIDHGGRPVWISPGMPGSVHGLTAARSHSLLRVRRQVDGLVFGDKGYQGATCGTVAANKGCQLADPYHQANRAHAHTRGPGERSFATLADWHILDQLRCCPLAVAYYAPPSWFSQTANDVGKTH